MSTEAYSQEDGAGRRIADAERNRSGTLDLSHLGLTTLPDALFQLTNLTRLYLGGNEGLCWRSWWGQPAEGVSMIDDAGRVLSSVI